jgi:MYXO-CTERM domain-containing protein
MVTSNVENDALGDGVTLVRRRLRVSGTAAELTTATGGCQAATASTKSPSPMVLLMPALLVLLRLRRQAQRGSK